MKLLAPSRKTWLDALRAVAMILVVLGHQVKGNGGDFFVITSPVKMPLFFAISGYLFNIKDGRYSTFLKNLCSKLIIPWLFLGTAVALIKTPFSGLESFMIYLGKMVKGEVLWFMPCFIVAEIIHFVIRKYCKSDISVIVLCFVSLFVGLLFSRMGALDFAMINRAFVVQAFFLIGYIFKRYEDELTGMKWRWVICGFLLYGILIGLSNYLFPHSSLDVHLNRYYSLPLCLALIYVGCISLFTAASKLSIDSSILSFVGQNTLVLYIWHGHAVSILSFLMGLMHISRTHNWSWAIAYTMWAILFCGVCSIIINRFAPALVGKRQIK